MSLGFFEYIAIISTLITIAVRQSKFFYPTLFFVLIGQLAIIDYYKSGPKKDQTKQDRERANKIICIRYAIQIFGKVVEICL